MNSKIIKKDSLLNKSVRINLLEFPNDMYVEVIYSETDNVPIKETRYKKDVFNELDKLVAQDKLKKAYNTILSKKNSKGDIKKTNTYNFATGMMSKKTLIKVVPSYRGIHEEDRLFLDGLTSEVRTAHFQSGNQVLKSVLTGSIALTMFTGALYVGFDQDAANKEYQALKDYRNRLVEQDSNVNVFGEAWTEEVHAQYQENLKDNVDTPEELVAYDKFWSGEELESLKEKKNFLNQWYELKGDYEDAKEEVGKKLGN